MDIISAISQRVSFPKLTGPAPTPQVIDQLIQCALRAPDHARLRPSRFIQVSGEERQILGEHFLKSINDWQALPVERQEKFRKMLMRAPVVLFCITKIVEHPKVPREEQLMSTAAAIQNMLIAAYARGIGAIWRTGDMAYNQSFKKTLQLESNEEIAGILYLGRPEGEAKTVIPLDSADFLTHWQSETTE